MTAVADERDEQQVADIMRELDKIDRPRVGDYVRFSCGTLRRISYHWTDGAAWDGGYQTSDGGSWHLGRYGASFSGGLYPCVPADSLALTGETMAGSCWIFHHNTPRAHNGVDFEPDWRVYSCDRAANH